MSEVPIRDKILTSTWAIKNNSNGTYRARINGRGYEQIEGQNYDESSIHAPVTNDCSVRIIMVLVLMERWYGQIVDVKGAFLNGHLDHEKEKMYMHLPEGFKRYYPTNVYLLLMKALHGTKQAAMVFWKELLKCMRDMKYQRSGSGPYMYFRWFDLGLVV